MHLLILVGVVGFRLWVWRVILRSGLIGWLMVLLFFIRLRCLLLVMICLCGRLWCLWRLWLGLLLVCPVVLRLGCMLTVMDVVLGRCR